MSDVAQVVGFSFGVLFAFAALAGLIWLLLWLYMEREFNAELEGEDIGTQSQKGKSDE
jgi:uncharacterized iron-regulated membrane protein